MSIRTYCPHCKKWVDLCQEVFGFKFVKLDRDSDGDVTPFVNIDDTVFETEESADHYKCGNCYNHLLVHPLVEDVLFEPNWKQTVRSSVDGQKETMTPIVWLERDSGINTAVPLRDIETLYPQGIPDQPDFCYSTDDVEREVEDD